MDTGKMLRDGGLSLSVAESCTGGLLSKLITDTPGCSDYFQGGVISYSNEVKIKLLGVSPETLEEFGAVSSNTALEMADGVRRALSTDIALAVTGIAGPGGGSPHKPVGLVFVALSRASGESLVREFHFKGPRQEVRQQSANAALALLMECMKEMEGQEMI